MGKRSPWTTEGGTSWGCELQLGGRREAEATGASPHLGSILLTVLHSRHKGREAMGGHPMRKESG